MFGQHESSAKEHHTALEKKLREALQRAKVLHCDVQ